MYRSRDALEEMLESISIRNHEEAGPGEETASAEERRQNFDKEVVPGR